MHSEFPKSLRHRISKTSVGTLLSAPTGGSSRALKADFHTKSPEDVSPSDILRKSDARSVEFDDDFPLRMSLSDALKLRVFEHRGCSEARRQEVQIR